FAHGARDPHVGQKIHLKLVGAVAFARFAASALDVEAEAAFAITAGLRLWQLGVQFADFVKDLDVRGRVGARRAANGRLVDGDQLIEVIHALDSVVVAGMAVAAVEVTPQGFAQHVVDQRAFARARHARHADERSQRQLGGDVLEVVLPGVDDLQPVFAGRPSPWRDFDGFLARQVFAGDAARG